MISADVSTIITRAEMYEPSAAFEKTDKEERKCIGK